MGIGEKREGVEQLSLTKNQLAALRRAARTGSYHLLTGAGMSLETRSLASGELLPGGAALSKQLASQFDVPRDDVDLLHKIYNRAVRRHGADVVYKWFRAKFWNVEPPIWMDNYARFPWDTVWTLNVDGSFETAYQRTFTESSRELISLNWDDDYRSTNDLNVIHLHGMVDTEDPRELVFSLPEYGRSAQSRATWPGVFRDVYGNSPFVIVGARMVDEPDLEQVVDERRPAHSAPSFYVSPDISNAMESDLRSWGLIPVRMTGEEFVSVWEELTNIDTGKAPSSRDEVAMQMGQQFVQLELQSQKSKVHKHDFLGGDEPEWADVLDGRVAETTWISELKQNCNIASRIDHSSVLVSYAGGRLTGRTAGLLSVGEHLKKNYWRTFLFRNGGRIERETVLRFASFYKDIALLFDGAADVADDIDQLITEARRDGLRILCVAVDDLDRSASLIDRISSGNLLNGRIYSVPTKINRTSATRLVDLLEREGRLGMLESKSDKYRIDHFSRRDIFSSMAEVENAPGFGRRVGILIDQVADPLDLNLILLAAFASKVSKLLTIEDAARMTGRDTEVVRRRVESGDPMRSLLSTDGVNVRARQRWLALAYVVEVLGVDSAAKVVRDAIIAVAGRVNPKSTLNRNPTALLVGSLMGARQLREVFPDADLDEWYASLRPYFGDWSGRFWEQRAILGKLDGRTDPAKLARAESYAYRATQLRPDSYSHTTLATVLLQKAATPDFDAGLYYSKAIAEFETASRLSQGGNDIVTWSAFLRGSLQVLSKLKEARSARIATEEDVTLWDSITSDWLSVWGQLESSRTSSDQLAEDLSRIHRGFRSIVFRS